MLPAHDLPSLALVASYEQWQWERRQGKLRAEQKLIGKQETDWFLLILELELLNEYIRYHEKQAG